ncbi:D-ribose ABC transporter substrate-binding protein [Aggregatilineales bacterium SYSU G02658]
MLQKLGKLLGVIGILSLAPMATMSQEGYTIGVSISRLSNPFFISLVEGAQETADRLGVELIVVDAADNPSTEAANIEDLIAQGVDAILINPTDSDAVVPSVAAANAAGIPVFTIDRSANGGDIVSHIASDNVAGGVLAAQYLCRKLGGTGSVVELEGIPGTSAARDRGAGFNAYMSESCPGVTIVARQTANFNRAEGLTVFENILQAQADIDGVFAHNDDMILGAIEAANAAGRAGIVFVGFDAVDDAVAAVRAGTLAATVAQQPALMGAIGVETAVSALNGETVDDFIPVSLRIVQNITLGVSISRLSNPFFISLVEGAQSIAGEIGAELIVVDAADNPSTEAANIEDLIAQGVDAILINPTDSDAVVPSVAAANAAGIPVFTIDRSANGGDIVSHIASDNVAGGALAAEYLCNALGGTGSVVELEGIPGTSAARDRGAGFNAYMSESCPGVTIVARQTANFNRAEGLTVFENILQAQADIDGVFAHNDDMILGAIEAANAAGRAGIVFVGFDAVDDAVAAVQAGTLAATVAQQPALMGAIGVETAAAFLAGADVDAFIPVGLSLVTNE